MTRPPPGPLAPMLLALLLLAPPGAAPALTPSPQCAVDPGTGDIFPLADPRGTEIVWPIAWPGGIVGYEWRTPDLRLLGVIQHCPTGASLRWWVPAHRVEAARAAIEGMLTSDIAHGYDDVRREIRLLGGRTRQTGSPGRCACDAVAGF